MSTEAMAQAVIESASEPADSGVDAIAKENLDPNFSGAPQTEGELKEAVKEAVDAGASKEDVKQMIKEYEIKVNGKKKMVKLDLSDEKDIIRRLQMAEAGQHAMQESSELKKLVENELQRARQNPWDFLKELGLDPDDLAEQRIVQKVEELKKSPEQLEREKLQKELEAARAELEKERTAKEEFKMTQLREKAKNDLDKEVSEAFESHPNLPRTQKTVRRIADAMLWAAQNGYEDVKVADVVPAVEEEIRREFNEFVSALPEDAIEHFLGKNLLEKMRKKRVAEAKKTQDVAPLQTKSVTAPKPEKKEQNKDKTDLKDYFKSLRRI